MDDRDPSTCPRCGEGHDARVHVDPDAARAELARACRDARVDDVLLLAAHADLLDARAWLSPRGYSPRACIEFDRARRRTAA